MRHCGTEMTLTGHGVRCSECGKTVDWHKKSDQEKKKEKKEDEANPVH